MSDSMPPPTDRLKWTRVMEGEYQGHASDGTIYYVDFVSSGCPDCDHRHEGWELSYRDGPRRYRLQYPSMRTAKVGAELAARALSGDA